MSRNTSHESGTPSPDDTPEWLHQRHIPSAESEERWAGYGLPAHADIITGFLATNNFIFGIPPKKEIFRLSNLRREMEAMWPSPTLSFDSMMTLHYIKPSPLPLVSFVHAAEPLGIDEGGTVEVNYNVRLQALVCAMYLSNIKVISGSEHDSSKMVFEGTECPGPANRRQIRVVRITQTVDDMGTWQSLAETTYPSSAVF